VCLLLDAAADEQIEAGLGRAITKSEAIANLKRTSEAGLVHVAVATDDGKTPYGICSCCPCCCYSISSMKRFGFHDSIISSDMIASQDEELCNDCGICVDRCNFDARVMSGGKLIYKREKCFGCGLCLSYCPQNAIALVKRRK